MPPLSLSSSASSSSAGNNHNPHHPRRDHGIVPAAKLVGFLVLLPCIVTYAHLRHQLYASSTIRDWLVISGKHAPGLYVRSEGGTGNFYKLAWGQRSGVAWDVIQLAHSMTAASITTTPQLPQKGRPYLVPAVDLPDNVPCLHKADDSMVCNSEMVVSIHAKSSSSSQTAPVVPTLLNSNNSSSSSSSNTRTSTAPRLLQNSSINNQRKDSLLYTLLAHIPATSLLMAVNVMLAAFYWNGRVPVPNVALLYASITSSPFEAWRVLSGTTAHFEVWHLGLNMMSLLALGQELEASHTLFSSISFFLYNVSLIPIVAGLWWMLQRYLVQTNNIVHSNARLAAMMDTSRPTVGYSGVLFCWMVVASLEQRSTCPIIFLPHVCFATHSWGPYDMFKFNVAPLIQLVLLQVILPRVSLTGHLAGILAGFLLYWGFLPLQLVQPALLIPFAYLAYLKWIRNVIPASALTIPTTSQSTAVATDDHSRQSQQQQQQQQQQQPQQPYYFLFRCQLVTLFLSSTFLGLFTSLTISFAVTLLYWHCLRHALLLHDEGSSAAIVIAKGYVVAAVLVLIFDAMTVGSWFAYYEAALFPLIVIVIRAGVLIVSVTTVVQHVIPAEASGILEWTLGFTTLQPCRRLVGHPWLTYLTGAHLSNGSSNNSSGVSSSDARTDVETGTKWVPFSGGGQRLGDR